MIDDSTEKCKDNSPYNCINPVPFISLNNSINNRSCEHIKEEDTELHPEGKLYSYIFKLSQCKEQNVAEYICANPYY